MVKTLYEFKVRFLGDFSKVQAIDEYFNLLKDWSANYRLLPNEIPIRIPNFNNGRIEFESHIQFFEKSKKYKIEILPEGIDFICTQKDEFTKFDIFYAVEKAATILPELINTIGIKSYRMSLIVGAIFIGNVEKKIFVSFDEYNSDEVVEWNAGLVTREDIKFNGRFDNVNIVTNFIKSEQPHNIIINNTNKKYEGLRVVFDINTIFKGNIAMYDSDDLIAFIKEGFPLYLRKEKSVLEYFGFDLGDKNAWH